MFQDLRYSVRSLLKRPGFTIVVVATLALGIGVNAAIFSVFNIMLRPLPVKEPESIVRLLWESTRRADSFSFPYYSYIRDHNQSFSDVIAVYEEEQFLLGETVSRRSNMSIGKTKTMSALRRSATCRSWPERLEEIDMGLKTFCSSGARTKNQLQEYKVHRL